MQLSMYFIEICLLLKFSEWELKVIVYHQSQGMFLWLLSVLKDVSLVN